MFGNHTASSANELDLNATVSDKMADAPSETENVDQLLETKPNPLNITPFSVQREHRPSWCLKVGLKPSSLAEEAV